MTVIGDLAAGLEQLIDTRDLSGDDSFTLAVAVDVLLRLDAADQAVTARDFPPAGNSV